MAPASKPLRPPRKRTPCSVPKLTICWVSDPRVWEGVCCVTLISVVSAGLSSLDEEHALCPHVSHEKDERLACPMRLQLKFVLMTNISVPFTVPNVYPGRYLVTKFAD